MNIEMVIGGFVLLAIIAFKVFGQSQKTSDRSFTGKETQTETKNLLAETDTFLAFEQFDQAEEFVRNAMASDPNNFDFHAKLLEVFYAAGNKKGYEEAAKVLHDKVNGQGPHWDMALSMWQEMSPNRALFETEK